MSRDIVWTAKFKKDYKLAIKRHPLRGKNIPYGPRFPDMSEAYDKELIRKADAIAAEKGIKFFILPYAFLNCSVHGFL